MLRGIIYLPIRGCNRKPDGARERAEELCGGILWVELPARQETGGGDMWAAKCTGMPVRRKRADGGVKGWERVR